jgi:glycerate 2-kinase
MISVQGTTKVEMRMQNMSPISNWNVPETCKAFLTSLFEEAVRVALPEHCMEKAIQEHLKQPPTGRLIVIGAGKASAAMAQAFEKAWEKVSNKPIEGLVVTRYGYGAACRHIEIVEAAHPVPDKAGQRAAERILALAQSLREDDLMVALISGGGSALLPLAVDGITLQDKQAVSKALLKSGASIGEINIVRSHLSRIKGGRLAQAAYPASTLGLLISDVPGDDPALIASGPTVASNAKLEQADAILKRYGIQTSESVEAVLNNPLNETPKPDDEKLVRTKNVIIAAPQASLEAAAQLAEEHGITPLILSDAIEGEAREVGKVMAAISMQVKRHNQPTKAPCVLLSGGETTVTVKGNGKGGRNVEFLLGFAESIRGEEGIYALACDTDGVDGAEEVAGAIVTPDTLQKAEARGISLQAALDNNDGHSFFNALGDQVITGPTRTNVNDFRAILIV